MKEHNVFFGMDYIIQGTFGGETFSSAEHEGLNDVNDEEVPQGIHDVDVRTEEDQSSHNSIKQECDFQPFTFIDPLTDSHDGFSQDHASPEHTNATEWIRPKGVKKSKRLRKQ